MYYEHSHSFSLLKVIALVALYFFVAVSYTHAYEDECGSMHVWENIIKRHKQSQNQTSIKHEPNVKAEEKCKAEDYYDSVYTIETQHFQVMYVLAGPHATTKQFADSTAAILERAWDFYINQHKMHAPKSPTISHHFRKPIKDGLYPVEIIDVNQVRDNIIEGNGCTANFAVTYPFGLNGNSEIFMENDFYSTCNRYNDNDTIFVHGDTCTYPKTKNPLRNNTYNYSYTDEWVKGLRVTIFHEFYHSIQLTYLNTSVNFSFWFEASATGFEEITNPEIDDYLRYIPKLFANMGHSLSEDTSNYGASTLFLYLYLNVSKELDRLIWENYYANPTQDFEYQLESALKKRNLNADSIFHDYALKLSFSGNHTEYINKKNWIIEDQPKWPDAPFLNQDSIKPNIESLAFEFYTIPQFYSAPYTTDFTDFIGKASVIVYNNGKASIYKVSSNKTLDSLTTILATSDSSAWIFSRLGKSESIPISNSTAEPHAFPVPWKQGPLCFAPLPKDKKFIEIRNRRGDLISQEKYEGSSYCLQEEQVKSMMAPGIHRFRVGNKGKTKSFIIVY
ncbi:hypothetical protein [Fibrobacter sp. UWB12]|uniref:hypothetical protein n=1 Tax=Fibrobacter sp. UWB12 TaxID=1896203 RepID=UPI00091B21BC|nr:hypothetical protein [Fibrobacter sp. UWB12]SHK43502.1 hypothetical protein SAMN05720759_102467 [Fibrobacter sp. UWB12]